MSENNTGKTQNDQRERERQKLITRKRRSRARTRLKVSEILTGVRPKSSHINATRSASVYGAEAKFAKKGSGKSDPFLFSRE
jgi:hypothetical protein